MFRQAPEPVQVNQTWNQNQDSGKVHKKIWTEFGLGDTAKQVLKERPS